MKGKIITAIVLTAALTASIAAPTAFAATEGAPVSAVEQQSTQSSITSITATQDIYKTGVYYNFDIVTVSGTSKLQIKYPTTTGTFHRTHEKVTIADNGDGTETWTVPVKTNDTLTVEARAKIGSAWETEYASATYEIKQEPVVEQKIVSVSTHQETIFADSKNVPFEIVATTGAAKMQVVYPASTATYTRTHARITITDNGDGTETWTVPAHANANGTATFRVKYKAWSENYVYEYEVKSEEERCISVSLEPNEEGMNPDIHTDIRLVIVTTPDVTKIRFNNVLNNSIVTFTKTSPNIIVTENEDGTVTWTTIPQKYAEGYHLYDIYVYGSNGKFVYTGMEKMISFFVNPTDIDIYDVWIEKTGNKERVYVKHNDLAENVRLVSADGTYKNFVFYDYDSEGDIRYAEIDSGVEYKIFIGCSGHTETMYFDTGISAEAWSSESKPSGIEVGTATCYNSKVKITTGTEVKKLRIVNDETGSSITLYADKNYSYAEIRNGTEQNVWTLNKALKPGTYSIYTGGSDYAMIDSGKDLQVANK